MLGGRNARLKPLTTKYVTRPSSPAVNTVARSSLESVSSVPTRTTATPVTTTDTCPSRPIRANGISIHFSHLMSRS